MSDEEFIDSIIDTKISLQELALSVNELKKMNIKEININSYRDSIAQTLEALNVLENVIRDRDFYKV